MTYKMFSIMVISFSLFLVSSCNNSSVGPNIMNITGTYSYKTIDSSGTILDSGILILTQIDSTITGEIHTQTESARLLGQIKYSGSLNFTENPAKILSPFWNGVWENESIQGYVEVDTGGRPTPVYRHKFIAIFIPDY